MDEVEKAGQSSPPWDGRTSIKSTGSDDLRDRIAELEAETRKMQEHRFHLERKLTQLESAPKPTHHDHEVRSPSISNVRTAFSATKLGF